MTALSAASKAMMRTVATRPGSLFSNTDPTAMEMADLINEVADEVFKFYDWERLLRLCNIVGDGATIEHPMPVDYDRMPVKQDIHPSSWTLWRYTQARDRDQWLDFMNGLPTVSPGFWIILGGTMNIFPPIQTGDTANFYYASNHLWRDANGDPKREATEDSDTFMLPERLLTLGLIWKWRAQKGLEYGEDMRTYEIALAQEINRDRGSRIQRGGGRTGRWRADGRWAYPLPLGQ